MSGKKKKEIKDKRIFLGLNIGTKTVGFAVTDAQHNLCRIKGNDAWGVSVFEKGESREERRLYRSNRRKLNRRKQRILLLKEIFAAEIAKVDEKFYTRLSNSYIWRDEADELYSVFNDDGYTDREYLKKYPTIHHLICDLMDNKEPHDVRLVYLACSWLLANRGHFLMNMGIERINEITDIHASYQRLVEYFTENSYKLRWDNVDLEALGTILKKDIGVKEKSGLLISCLLNGRKPDKELHKDFPFREDQIIKLLAGGKCKVSDIFGKDEYKEFGSISLNMDDEAILAIISAIDTDGQLIECLRHLYDWSILANIMGNGNGNGTISGAKVAIYEQHKQDLATLKYFIKKYVPEKYGEVFRAAGSNNYAAYVAHADKNVISKIKKKATVDGFSEYILKIIKNIVPDQEEQETFKDMVSRLENQSFMPKQKNTDNRVIPHELYEIELKKILENASRYLPFLLEKKDGLSEAEKVMSIFRFKIPYYIGPLNPASEHAWISRKAEKITPWNFDDVVNADESEAAFIRRQTNQCTYLPGEDVLPRMSMCYQTFAVLNEINNIKVNGEPISIAAKQGIFNEMFLKRKTVKVEHIEKYLIEHGFTDKDGRAVLSGIDVKINNDLSSHYAFRHFLQKGKLTETDVERIIERSSYAEDKSRLGKWLKKQYPYMEKDDVKYICRIKANGFGSLSKKFLTELEGADKKTGEITTILQAMWNTNDTLPTLLSGKYTFAEEIEAYRTEYYQDKDISMDDRMDQLFVPNSSRRPIYRALAIINDVEKAFGVRPEKIFIGMNRGFNPNNDRAMKRKDQILSCYAACKKGKYAMCSKEDVEVLKHQLDSLGDRAEDRLRSDRLFLYFLQFGKCAYSGSTIDFRKLMAGSMEYNIDHIYPRSYVHDDSIANNKVLVCSKINRDKDTCFPLDPFIQKQMKGMWTGWLDVSSINDEKYARLVRTTPFSDEEKSYFVADQLTDSSRSAKAMVEILKAKYADTDISVIPVKLGLVNEFRNEFDLPKSSLYNDLHNAIDAYLTAVTGDVYTMKFSKRWFSVKEPYTIRIKALFTHMVKCGNRSIWSGVDDLEKTKRTAMKMSAKVVRYPVYKKGQLFDLNPVKKKPGLIPIKAGLPTERYGGYTSAKSMGFIPVRYMAGAKTDVIIINVEVMHGERFMKDGQFALKYCVDKVEKILGKKVDEISFPLGTTVWRSGTTLSFDGFRMCLTGTNGKQLSFTPIMQFITDPFWIGYLKRMDRFIEKNRTNTTINHDQKDDKISTDENAMLYKVYIDKLQNSVYRKHPNPVTEILIKGENKFRTLNILDQCKTLLSIQTLFGRTSTGANLTAIGGYKISGSTGNLSSTISNWKKKYTDVRLISQSPAGFWEKVSENLFDIL